MLRLLPLLLLFLQYMPSGAPHSVRGGSIGPITHAAASVAGFCDTGSSAGIMSGSSCPVVATRTLSNYTPTTTGNGLIVGVGCASTILPTGVAITGTGWTFTQIGSIAGSSGQYMAAFRAYAPNTTAAGFIITWTAASCGGFMNVTFDEWAGMNATNFVDNSFSTTGASGGCAASITPTQTGTTLWSMCNDTVTGVGSGYTKGADDTAGDWTQYKIGAGSGSQSAAFTSSGSFTQFIVAVK